MSVGMLILRVVVGLLFFGHGTQKLFGWFGGAGREGTAAFFGSLGYRSASTLAIVGGIAEGLGGLLVLLGLLTPLGSALIIGMMVSAIVVVHMPRGLWNQNRGIELPLTYIAAATAIAFGPGRYSLDRMIGLGWDARVAGVLALAVGVFAGLIVTATMHRPPAAAGEEHGAEEPRRAA